MYAVVGVTLELNVQRKSTDIKSAAAFGPTGRRTVTALSLVVFVILLLILLLVGATDSPGGDGSRQNARGDSSESVAGGAQTAGEDYVAMSFPNKTTKHVFNSLRPSHIKGFLQGMPLVFQPGKSGNLSTTYHFTFTGEDKQRATLVIADNIVTVDEGHVGTPGLHVNADRKTWIGFLRGGADAQASTGL